MPDGTAAAEGVPWGQIAEVGEKLMAPHTCNVKIVNSTNLTLELVGEVVPVRGKGHTVSSPAGALRPRESTEFRYEADSVRVVDVAFEGAHAKVTYRGGDHVFQFEWVNPIGEDNEATVQVTPDDRVFQVRAVHGTGNSDVQFLYEVSGGAAPVPAGQTQTGQTGGAAGGQPDHEMVFAPTIYVNAQGGAGGSAVSVGGGATGGTATGTGGTGTGGTGTGGTGTGGTATGGHANGSGGAATSGAAAHAHAAGSHSGGGNVYLTLGSSGPTVIMWQQELNIVLQACLVVDGAFGGATEHATRQFQAAHGLATDGLVGPKTLGMMEQVLAGHGTCPAPITATPVGGQHEQHALQQAQHPYQQHEPPQQPHYQQQPQYEQPQYEQPHYQQQPQYEQPQYQQQPRYQPSQYQQPQYDQGGADPYGTGAAQAYHPATHGAYDPNVHGPFHPDVHGQFHPDLHGPFDPNVHGLYHPAIHGAYDPNIHGPFHESVHGAYDPQIHGSAGMETAPEWSEGGDGSY